MTIEEEAATQATTENQKKNTATSNSDQKSQHLEQNQ